MTLNLSFDTPRPFLPADGASGVTAIAAPALKRMPSSLREKERLAALAAEQAAKSIRASTVVKAAFGCAALRHTPCAALCLLCREGGHSLVAPCHASPSSVRPPGRTRCRLAPASPLPLPPRPCRAWLALMVAYISTFRLWGRELVWGLGFGVLWGAGLATVYQYNRKRKHERRQLVRVTEGVREGRAAGTGDIGLPAGLSAAPCRCCNALALVASPALPRCPSRSPRVPFLAPLPPQLAIIPGAKGMQELLHHIPTWISFRETEKMEV